MKFLLPTLILLSATSIATAQTTAKSSPRQSASAVSAAPERELTPAELEVASRVYVGHLPCELGQTITITPDAQAPGYFDLKLKKTNFRMHAVQSKSGAVRLDAVNGDAVWIQVANKSMLVNAKLGKRLVDVCTSPEQIFVAQAFEKAPPPSLLDEPAPAAPTNPTDACQATGLIPPSQLLNGKKPC